MVIIIIAVIVRIIVRIPPPNLVGSRYTERPDASTAHRAYWWDEGAANKPAEEYATSADNHSACCPSRYAIVSIGGPKGCGDRSSSRKAS